MLLALLLAASVPFSCNEIRDILNEGGMTPTEVREIVGRCEAINNPEPKNQNDA